MKRISLTLAALALCAALLAGCPSSRQETPAQTSRRDAIPFAEGQLYALAYLGYQEADDLDYYAQRYLDNAALPVHYLSAGDYYLVIPRYDDMALSLYQGDINTLEPALIFEDPHCEPFLLQCNASDIFADATVRLTYNGETAEFSPFISLKDGSIDPGPRGLLLTLAET